VFLDSNLENFKGLICSNESSSFECAMDLGIDDGAQVVTCDARVRRQTACVRLAHTDDRAVADRR
jgi:hypothetical protein